jgi:Ulp1 family protease
MQTEQQRYARVKNWTKNVDIFAHDYILIPIHDTAHWSLAIVCQPGELPW